MIIGIALAYRIRNSDEWKRSNFDSGNNYRDFPEGVVSQFPLMSIVMVFFFFIYLYKSVRKYVNKLRPSFCFNCYSLIDSLSEPYDKTYRTSSFFPCFCRISRHV